MYTLESTTSAYVNAPDSAFCVVSKHRTKMGVARALAKARKAMVGRCGISAWDRNFRIIDPNGAEVNQFDLAAMVEK